MLIALRKSANENNIQACILTFVSFCFFPLLLFFSSNELSFPREEKKSRGIVIHHYIDLVSHPLFFFFPSLSPFPLFVRLNIDIRKKTFVKLGKCRETTQIVLFPFCFVVIISKYFV